jgi:hypothetical protein
MKDFASPFYSSGVPVADHGDLIPLQELGINSRHPNHSHVQEHASED